MLRSAEALVSAVRVLRRKIPDGTPAPAVCDDRHNGFFFHPQDEPR
jgi:hypothetical protein